VRARKAFGWGSRSSNAVDTGALLSAARACSWARAPQVGRDYPPPVLSVCMPLRADKNLVRLVAASADTESRPIRTAHGILRFAATVQAPARFGKRLGERLCGGNPLPGFLQRCVVTMVRPTPPHSCCRVIGAVGTRRQRGSAAAALGFRPRGLCTYSRSRPTRNDGFPM